jgi:hypothetical protein
VSNTASIASSTLSVKRFSGLLLNPEVRDDWSNQRVFATRQQQVTFGLSAAYLF